MLIYTKPAQMRAIPLLVASLFCSAAQAQQPAVQLEDVRVESGIIPDDLELVPGSTQVLSNKELQERRPFSINEVMREANGFNVVGEDSFGVAPNIGLRGLNPRRSARTLLLEDGMPLFLGPYGDPSAHYSTPVDRIDRVEILKGSGQILYGPQSVGGMINFVTKPVPRNGFAGSATISAGTDSFYGLAANIGTGGEWGGVMLDLIKKEGDGIRENHDFEITETMLKGELVLSSRHTLITKLGYYTERSHTSETGLSALEYAENPFQAPTGRNDFFVHDRTTFQAISRFDVGDTATLSTQFYFTDAFRRSFRQIDEPEDRDDTRSVLSNCPAGVDETNLANANSCGGQTRPRSYQFYGIEPKLDFTHNAFGVANIATVGFRYHKEEIDRAKFEGDSIATAFQGNADIFDEQLLSDIEATSIYFQNTFAWDTFSLTPGLRYENIDRERRITQADGNALNLVENASQSEVLPGLGFTYTGIAGATVFGGIHEGFAPPRPDRDLEEDPNGDLLFSRTDAEKSTNIELGVRATPYAGVNMEVTVFNIDFSNLVVGPNALGQFINAGAAEHTGSEFLISADLDQFFNTRQGWYSTFAYTNLAQAEFKTDANTPDAEGEDGYGNFSAGNRLPYAPEHIINASIGFDRAGPWSARLGVNYISEQFANSDNTVAESPNGAFGIIPSYTLWNAQVNFRPAGSQFSYFLAAENLFDKEYLASRVNAKQAGRGRQLVVGLRASF